MTRSGLYAPLIISSLPGGDLLGSPWVPAGAVAVSVASRERPGCHVYALLSGPDPKGQPLQQCN